MRRLLYSIVLFIAIFLLASCANRKTAATLDDVETYIQTRPDSALATIRAIDTTTLTTRGLRAHYALLHAMALDKNWIDTTNMGVVMPAVTYFDQRNANDVKAKAWYYLGRIQENAGDLPKAIVSFTKAEQYIGQTKDKTFQAFVFQAISNVYNKAHFHEEALRYTESAYSLFEETGDSLRANASLYRMAQDLNNVKRYAESDSLYRLLIYERPVYPRLMAPIKSNYALNLIIHREDYQQAVSLFDEVVGSYGSLSRANYWGAYAYALTNIGKKSQADQIFKQLERKEGDLFIYSSWKSLADAYEGNYVSAYDLQKAASAIQEQNVYDVLRQSVVKAQRDYQEQINAEEEHNAERRRLVVWICSCLLILIAIVLFFGYRHRIEQAELEKESLLDAFRDLMTDRTKVRNHYIQICQSQFGNIGRINEILLYHSNETDNNLYKELKRALQKIGMDAQNQQAFEKELNETFDNVMSHFREAFPGKKPRYYQLVSLLFAGFDAATICAIMPDYKKYNIYVEKHRLKQLINSSDTSYKEQFTLLIA